MRSSKPRRWKNFGSGWRDLVKRVQQLPPHVDLWVAKASVSPPNIVGFRKSVGWKKGSIANWRLALANGRSIHAREYRDHFRIHWDIADPRKNPLRHLVYDTRKLFNALRVSFALTLTAVCFSHPDILQSAVAMLEKGLLYP
ncbi:MAG: hypothetical protein QW767_03195 [Thermoprotei archaeon]